MVNLDLHIAGNLPSDDIFQHHRSPATGSNLRIAYQGVPGAYSEAAAGKAFPNSNTLPCAQFDVVFHSVEHSIADLAVLPIENSLGGSIHRNYDLLLRHNLHIIGEIQFPVHHCLLALPGERIENLTRVISHPQALAQCEHTLTKLGLEVPRDAVDDTAGAAELIAGANLRNTAAIASARAAEIYGLEVLADGIQDDPRNVTRFVILSRDPTVPRMDGKFKTSLVVALEQGTPTLVKVLGALDRRGLRLRKIEARPNRRSPVRLAGDGNGGTVKEFEYVFFVDLEGSMAEERVRKAVVEVEEFTSFMRILGSYPMDGSSWNVLEN